MRKFLSVMLVLALCLALVGCGADKAPETTAAATEPATTAAVETTAAAKEDVVVLYTNDVHTYIDGPMGYDVVAGLKAELKEQYGNVLLADAGDAIQGTAFGSMDKGETIISLMNAAGYDVATLGNHEFDYGMDGCKNIIEKAQFPYVSCNFYEEKDGVRGENVLPSIQLFEMGGHKIAFVGVTTPESFTKSTPAYFQDENGNYIYGISGGEDGSALYADVQTAIDAAAAEGADVIIGLGHLGDDASSKPWTSEEVIANVTGLDAFIDGHSHSTQPGKEVADKNGDMVLLSQTGDYLSNIGMMVIDGETGKITSDLITSEEITETKLDDKGQPVVNEDGEEETEVVGYKFVSELYTGESWCSDETVKQMQDAWIQEIDTQLGQKIGATALTFDNYDAEGKRLVRSQETNTGDFAADALYYLFDDMGLDVDVAVMNGGGVRNKAITGDLTYKTAKEIHTFGNVACLQTITGQQLLDALEWGARTAGTGEECGGFLQVAGITYKIDTEWPTSVQMDDKGVWVGAPTGGYRVHDVQVYNKETGAYEPLNLEGSYNLAGYNYTLRDMGDGFNMFSGAVNVLDYVMEDYMVLANYIQGFEGGNVEAANSPLLSKYAGMKLNYSDVNGSGRIVYEAAKR